MLGKLYKKLDKGLAELDIPYMVIGGQATLIYREARFTNDVDIVLGVDIERYNDIAKLCEALNIVALPANPFEFTQQTLVLPALDKETNFRIDFLFSFTDYERLAISRAKRVKIDDYSVSYCMLEDLIIFKIFATRLKDIDDIKNMIVQNPDYNHKLVIKHLKELGELINRDLAGEFEAIRKSI
jgi:predicted nucleotidyltransferase